MHRPTPTIIRLALACLMAALYTVVHHEAKAESSPLHPQVAEIYRIGDNAYVRALAVDATRNSLWVGTSVGAMEVDLDSRELKGVHTREQGLANEYVFAIGVDPYQRIWLGTNAGGTNVRQEDNTWKTYFPMHGLADYWVYCFAFEGKDKTWIGTWDGVSVFDNKTQQFTTYRRELINVWVYGIDIDQQGRVWLGTEGGVSMYDKGSWRSWTSNDGLGAPNRKGLARSTNTGLGTRTRHDLTVTSPMGEETYNPDYVFAVKYDKSSQRVWFGTWGGGVSAFDGNDKWVSYTTQDGLAGNIVYSIAQEADGTLWFGTDRGVSRFDGATWTTLNKTDGLINDHIYAVAIDPAGMIWLGSKGGVTRLTYTQRNGG